MPNHSVPLLEKSSSAEHGPLLDKRAMAPCHKKVLLGILRMPKDESRNIHPSCFSIRHS
jgi:hypothetical protein